jgi:hypothetical protein
MPPKYPICYFLCWHNLPGPRRGEEKKGKRETHFEKCSGRCARAHHIREMASSFDGRTSPRGSYAGFGGAFRRERSAPQQPSWLDEYTPSKKMNDDDDFDEMKNSVSFRGRDSIVLAAAAHEPAGYDRHGPSPPNTSHTAAAAAFGVDTSPLFRSDTAVALGRTEVGLYKLFFSVFHPRRVARCQRRAATLALSAAARAASLSAAAAAALRLRLSTSAMRAFLSFWISLPMSITFFSFSLVAALGSLLGSFANGSRSSNRRALESAVFQSSLYFQMQLVPLATPRWGRI